MTGTTFEITFPRELNLVTAANMFTALAALFPATRPAGTRSDPPTVAFEVLATPGGIHHLVTVPPHLSRTVRAHLRATVPAGGLAEVERPRSRWQRAVELGGYGDLRPHDLELITTVLWSLTDLADGEAVLVQAVMTPLGAMGAQPDHSIMAGVARLAVAGEEVAATDRLKQVLASYRNLAITPMRTLPQRWLDRVARQDPPLLRWPLHLSATGLTLLCALPLGSPEVPGLVLGRGRRLQPDPHVPRTGRVVAQANFLGAERPLAIAGDDRLKHLYLIGPTGGGKSSLMLGHIIADMADGHGLAVIEPGGRPEDDGDGSAPRRDEPLVNMVLERVPRHRVDDVVLYDLNETERPVGFNVLAGEPYATAGQITTVLDQLFSLSASAPRALDALRSSVLTVALAGLTICEVPLILSPGPAGTALRRQLVGRIDDPALLDFWQWFEGLRPAEQGEVAAPIARRLRPLLLYPSLRASLGQATSGFQLDEVLAQRKILLVPLSRGQLGDELAFLVGALVLARLWNAILARPSGSPDFFVYLDEFQDLLKLPVALGEMFAQARARHVGLTVAHHHFGQLTQELRRDVLSNARSKVAFRVGVEDARVLAAEFGEGVTADDILNLGPYEVMVQLLADNRVTQPATGVTLLPPPELGWAYDVRARSRERYGRDRAEVEAELRQRHGIRKADPDPEPGPAATQGWDEWTDS